LLENKFLVSLTLLALAMIISGCEVRDQIEIR